MHTTTQIATICRISPSTVRRIAARLGLRPQRVGQAYVFTPQQAALLRAHARPAPFDAMAPIGFEGEGGENNGAA